jgi:4a-hydroxytetrahydrobiopterin dehydratase
LHSVIRFTVIVEDCMELSAERCVSCRPDSPVVSEAEERELLPRIPDWDIIEVNSIERLRRVFRLRDWMQAVEFARVVAGEAEAENHHPSILIEWGKVTVTWWTHAIKGLHRNDFIMAARTDLAFDRFA